MEFGKAASHLAFPADGVCRCEFAGAGAAFGRGAFPSVLVIFGAHIAFARLGLVITYRGIGIVIDRAVVVIFGSPAVLFFELVGYRLPQIETFLVDAVRAAWAEFATAFAAGILTFPDFVRFVIRPGIAVGVISLDILALVPLRFFGGLARGFVGSAVTPKGAALACSGVVGGHPFARTDFFFLGLKFILGIVILRAVGFVLAFAFCCAGIDWSGAFAFCCAGIDWSGAFAVGIFLNIFLYFE